MSLAPTIIDLSQATSLREYGSGIVSSQAVPASNPLDVGALRSAIIEVVQTFQTEIANATREALQSQNKQLNEMLQQYFEQIDTRFQAITEVHTNLETVVDSLIKIVALGNMPDQVRLAHQQVLAQFLIRDQVSTND